MLDLTSYRSAAAYLTLYRPTQSPRGENQNSPRQSPRTPPTPILISPKLLSQAQPTQINSPPPEGDSPKTLPQSLASNRDQTNEPSQNQERKSYFSSAITRVSQVFSWKSVSKINVHYLGIIFLFYIFLFDD
jgi:hypothetical protein